MNKIVITGSNGLLGQTLMNLLLKESDRYEVYGLSRGENRSERTDFTYHSVDITNYNEIRKTLKEVQPHFIVNTAAMTNVDACEDNQVECFKLNVTAVEYLKEYCDNSKCHLIHISTDFIFDGTQGFYKETDVPNPLSYYGWSKLKSEEILTKSTIDYTILRTILVFGSVNNLGKNNIVLWVKEMLEKGREISIVEDQFRMPTYVEDLAMACKISIDKEALGIFNISSNQLLSVYEIAQQIAEVFELDKSLIKPISTLTLNQRASRPFKTGFNLSKTNKNLGIYPKTFKEDLIRFKEVLT